MPIDLTTAHRDLWKWCRAQGFAGYDPYDGLNSRLFRSTPLKNSRTARLFWTQLFKRLPINLRSFARVPRERNAKGIALFALSAIANYRSNPTKENEIEARELLGDLISMSLKGFSGAAWGYNFDWQSRSFFAPRGTPTSVPTAFAARALCEAAELFGRDEYLPFARTICSFILNDLNRSEETNDEVCFSYSPLDRMRVFNASLLAAETLASVGKLTGEASLIDWAMRAARYVVRRQNDDGSWAYGADDNQSWSDNFHTAFVLTSLSRIIENCKVDFDGLVTEQEFTTETQRAQRKRREFMEEAETALRRGYDFWRECFFLSNAWPKYFPNRLYPADAHSAGAAMVASVELQSLDEGAIKHAETIARWAIENLRDRRGFFSYQRRRFHAVRIPYMRWSEAWMMYGISRLLEAKEIESRPFRWRTCPPMIECGTSPASKNEAQERHANLD